MNSFSEKQTERFYDREDAKYRSFWDSEGSLHWGYFSTLDETTPEAFQQGCRQWNDMMLRASNIDARSRVLDLGCGNGNTSLWLAHATGCEVVGIDLSGVRINNARESLASASPPPRVSFVKGSALELPFEEGEFTHVWSQATFYHVPDRRRAICEAFRVLVDRGVLIFDDLVSPTASINENAKTSVYDRLLFGPDMSHANYLSTLHTSGFFVDEHLDLSDQLRRNYTLLAGKADGPYPELSEAYRKMCQAIDERQVGWSYFRATKVADRLAWIYEQDSRVSLKQKYDHWARTYDSDLTDSYRKCPEAAAEMLAALVGPDQQVLDAGCGTGMVGECLASLDFKNIAGIDQSAEMLALARAKGVYRELKSHDLHAAGLPHSPQTFQAVISVGAFTFNHLRPSALDGLLAMLKPGGVLVVSARDDYMEHTPEFRVRLSGPGLEPLARRTVSIFENEAIHIMAFRKTGGAE